MEFRQLEYFIEVSRLKSFTHAAERLHVSQPSVTNSLNKLEEELGVKLLDRNTKRVSLTVKGEEFYTRVVEILAMMNEAVNEIKRSETTNIHIGLPPMIGAQFFPDVFCQFHQQSPSIQFQVAEKGSVAIRDMLEKGDLDLGFIVLPECSESLELLPVMEAELVICMPRKHPLAKKKQLQWSDIINESFIMLSDEFVHRSLFLEKCKLVGIEPNIIFNSDKIETVKNMVASGLGLSVLMDKYIETTKEIKGIPLKVPMTIKIGLAWKKGKNLSSCTKQLISFITSYYSNEARRNII